MLRTEDVKNDENSIEVFVGCDVAFLFDCGVEYLSSINFRNTDDVTIFVGLAEVTSPICDNDCLTSDDVTLCSNWDEVMDVVS